jgi:hypothetical protein
MPKTFLASGTTGAVAIGDSSTIDAALANPYSYLSNLNFHSSLGYLQLRTKLTVGYVYFDGFAQEYIYWSDGGCDCFTPDTKISVPEGTKNIVDIKVGDKVLGINGTINTVTFIEKVPDTVWEFLYSPDPKLKPFATVNHPLYIDGKLKAVDPNAVYDLYPWLGKPEPLDGYTLSKATGQFVYNLWLTGDGTYIANGYNTTSIMYTGDFLSYSFSKNWLTQQEVVDLLTYYTDKGKHTQYGAYLINKFLKWLNLDFVSKFIALQLRKEKSIVKSCVAKVGKLIGYILHPNR